MTTIHEKEETTAKLRKAFLARLTDLDGEIFALNEKMVSMKNNVDGFLAMIMKTQDDLNPLHLQNRIAEKCWYEACENVIPQFPDLKYENTFSEDYDGNCIAPFFQASIDILKKKNSEMKEIAPCEMCIRAQYEILISAKHSQMQQSINSLDKMISDARGELRKMRYDMGNLYNEKEDFVNYMNDIFTFKKPEYALWRGEL